MLFFLQSFHSPCYLLKRPCMFPFKLSSIHCLIPQCLCSEMPKTHLNHLRIICIILIWIKIVSHLDYVWVRDRILASRAENPWSPLPAKADFFQVATECSGKSIKLKPPESCCQSRCHYLCDPGQIVHHSGWQFSFYKMVSCEPCDPMRCNTAFINWTTQIINRNLTC